MSQCCLSYLSAATGVKHLTVAILDLANLDRIHNAELSEKAANGTACFSIVINHYILSYCEKEVFLHARDRVEIQNDCMTRKFQIGTAQIGRAGRDTDGLHPQLTIST